MKASNVIESAKLRAFPHTGPQQVPEGVLLKHLSNKDRDVVNRIAKEVPQVLSREARSMEVTNAKNANGYRLEDALAYTHFEIIDEDGKQMPITIVPEGELRRPHTHPAGAVSHSRIGDAKRFYPSDPQGESWEGSDDRIYFDPEHEIRYRYIPEVHELEDPDDDLSSPSFARSYLEQVLLVQILQTQPGVSEVMITREVEREQQMWQGLQMMMHRQVENESSLGTDTSPGLSIHEQIIS